MRGKIYLRTIWEPVVLVGDIGFGEPFLKIFTDDGKFLFVPLTAIKFIEVERKPEQAPQQEKPHATQSVASQA